jgi:DNA-binding Lrp family transcriptional regulator
MIEVDDLDRRLISLLRANGREPVARLAERLGVTRATVNRRLGRLVDSGVIVGFSIHVRESDGAAAVRAITLIAIEGPTARRVIESLRGIPEVAAVHTTNGRWDVIAEISCENLVTLEYALRTIRGISGIQHQETSILLNSGS